jgi:3-oxoacyl-[acyl-carrier-protein] synthase II
MSDRRRVVVTGIGVVSPNGVGRENFAAACRDGQSGIRPIQIDLTNLRSSVAGIVSGFDPTSVMTTPELRRVPRMIPMALAASNEALSQAQLNPDQFRSDIESAREIGVALGTGGGGLAYVEDQYQDFFTRGGGSLYAITAGTHGNLSSELSIAMTLRGPSHVLSTGCTSSTDAIGHAMMLIRAGTVPMMLAGGADSPISRGILTGFERIRVISTRRWDDPTRTSRPFSADRDGFVLAEGAWMFVLEDAEHAAKRGATVLAELAGYGSTCDAYHRVQIAPDVAEPVRAMKLAMADAGVSPDAIDYINLHGTGTILNDRLETAAVRKCFGDLADGIPCSSTKSMIGHAQGACGAGGIAATILSMRDDVLYPTINLEQPDSDCDLDYVSSGPRAASIETALCNCIAFGSKNSALVVQKFVQ